MSHKLAIVGSRAYVDKTAFEETVEQWIEENGLPQCIVTGDASGADAMAREYAGAHSIKLVVHRAEWSRYGRAAGPIRNNSIVKGCTAMIAFLAADGAGTRDSIAKAKAAGLEPHVIDVALSTEQKLVSAQTRAPTAK